MARIWIIGALMVLTLTGCLGRSHPVTLYQQEDFAELARDVERLAASAEVMAFVQAGRGRCDEARALAERGKRPGADWLYRLALADGQTALALAQAEIGAREASACWGDAARARRGLDDALRRLADAEKRAGRAAGELPFELPTVTQPESILPDQGVWILDPAALDTGALSSQWDHWYASAKSQLVAIGDLEIIFRRHLSASRDAQLSAQERPLHHHLATRTLQQLTARVSGATARYVYAAAVASAVAVGDATAEVLRLALSTERGLQGELQTQLDDALVAAQNRQAQLFDALREMEGEFARITQEARGTIVSLADILFDFDKATLKRDVEFNLVRIATILNQYPEMTIVVEGHTDNIGTPEYNLKLSEDRAVAVFDFLVSQRISPDRMGAQGFGMTRPIVGNDSAVGRARNRRVDLVIQDAP